MEKSTIPIDDGAFPDSRSLDDFILNLARYKLPNFTNFKKWGNKVAGNLLYYQTNYFYLTIGIFVIVGLLHPTKMLLSCFAIYIVHFAFEYYTSERYTVYNFKRNHPVAGVALIFLVGCFITYTIGAIVVLLFAILLSFSLVFIHASLRKRNIANKVVNQIESFGFKRTPMGIILQHFDDVTGFTLHPQRSFMQKTSK